MRGAKKAPEPVTETPVDVAPAPVQIKGAPMDPHELYRHVAHMLREEANGATAEIGDATSPFVLKRLAIADAIDDFLALCMERGHRGIS